MWLVFFSALSFSPTATSADSKVLATSHFYPIETRDQNLFNLIHGQPLPVNARLLTQTKSNLTSSLSITNTLNIETPANESIWLDYELYRLNLAYQYGIDEDWNFKIDIPLVHQTGGVFDSAIDSWHQFFGLPRANREFVEEDLYEVRYSTAQNQVSFDDSTSIGDIQLALAYNIHRKPMSTLSFWSAFKLPTGDETKLSGSGASDVSFWFALNQQLNEHWLLNSNAGIVLPGEDKFQGIALADQVFFGHIMLGWLINDNIQLKAQLQAHSSYYDETQLKILGNTFFLSVGGSIKINNCNYFDLALSEDLSVDSSPDASLLLSWRHMSTSC